MSRYEREKMEVLGRFLKTASDCMCRCDAERKVVFYSVFSEHMVKIVS